MSEKRLILIASFDDASHQEVAKIYSILQCEGFVGRQTKKLPYHITVGEFDLSQRDQVLARVRQCSADTAPFEIQLSHIGLFGLRVLFLTPSVNVDLLRLRAALNPDETVEGQHAWAPHTTILIDRSAQIQAAIPLVAKAFKPFTVRIDRIQVLELPPTEVLETVYFTA